MQQAPLHTSDRGVALIESFEDFSATPYLCPAGRRIVGFGHVIRKSEPHLRTAVLSLAQARALLRADIGTTEVYLNAVLPAWVRQHHFDALVSLVFDIGVGAFDRSALLGMIKAGDRCGAQAEFSKWIFSNGVRACAGCRCAGPANVWCSLGCRMRALPMSVHASNR